MRYYKSPYNKIIKTNDNKILLFIGITGKIVEIPNRCIKKLNDVQAEKAGIVLSNNFKTYLYRAKAIAAKNNANKKINIVIAPTMMCNFACSYCMVRESLNNKFITTEILDKIIDFIRINSSEYSIEWFGGEPSLASEKILYFYKKAEKYKLKNNSSLLITNGSFLEDNKIWNIIEHHITTIQITLDGMRDYHDKRRYDKNALTSSFDRILKNLDLLYSKIISGNIEHKIRVIIRCNIDKRNCNSYIALRNLIVSRYNFQFEIQAAQVQKTGNTNYDTYLMSNKEYSKFLIDLFYNHGIIEEPFLPPYRNFYQHCRVNNPYSYVFDPIGNIYKCAVDLGNDNKIIGNLMNNKKYNEEVETKYLLSTTDFLPNNCKKCVLLFFCFGGCPQKRINNNLKSYCPFQKSNLSKFIEIEYKLQKAREEISKFII